MRRVAVIAAVEDEVAPLVRRWTLVREGAARVWTGELRGATVIAACAGMGRAAARTAVLAVEKTGPVDGIVSYGFAGALRADLLRGQAVALAGAIDAATGARFPCAGLTRATGAGSADVFGTSPAGDAKWVVSCGEVAGAARKRQLSQIQGAGVVDMEAAAVAAMAAERGIEFHCLKGVTDAIDEQLPDFSRFIGRDGQFARRRAALHAALRPWLWRRLLRLSAASRTAALELSRLLGDTLST